MEAPQTTCVPAVLSRAGCEYRVPGLWGMSKPCGHVLSLRVCAPSLPAWGVAEAQPTPTLPCLSSSGPAGKGEGVMPQGFFFPFTLSSGTFIRIHLGVGQLELIFSHTKCDHSLCGLHFCFRKFFMNKNS